MSLYADGPEGVRPLVTARASVIGDEDTAMFFDSASVESGACFDAFLLRELTFWQDTSASLEMRAQQLIEVERLASQIERANVDLVGERANA